MASPFGVDSIGILLTLIVLESVLSFDNAAILAAMSRRLPMGEGRRRALNYGMAIAYILRVGAILAVFILLRYAWLLTVGGLYLVILFVKHAIELARGHDDDAPSDDRNHPARKHFGMSPLAFTVVQIGVVNLAFSLDQVVAAVGITRSKPLIIIAATIGLISLRVLAPYLSRLMDWLPILEDVAYVAVGFVGTLLVLEDLPYFTVHVFFHGSPVPQLSNLRWHAVHILVPELVKICITLGVFVVPLAIKLVFKWPKSHGPHHTTIEESLREASKPTPSVGALHHSTREQEASTVHEPYPPPHPVLPHGAELVHRVATRPGFDPPARPKQVSAKKGAKAAPKKAAKKRSGAKR